MADVSASTTRVMLPARRGGWHLYGRGVEQWFRFGGWMVVAVDAGVAWWAYLDVPGHSADPEVWRGFTFDGDDEPEDWEPTTGEALMAFLTRCSGPPTG